MRDNRALAHAMKVGSFVPLIVLTLDTGELALIAEPRPGCAYIVAFTRELFHPN